MILYTEDQLDEAWQYDCKIRSSFNANWISRDQYEKLFVQYLQCLAHGDKFIRLDIHIPDSMMDSIDNSIELEEEQLH
jgi:hypothetical protein